MPSPETLLLFLSAAVLVTLAPGPDNLMVIGLSMARGRRAGIAFGVGCGIGCLSHTLWAVLGVAAMIAAHPNAFLLLRVIGAAYLFWLGGNAIAATFKRQSAPQGNAPISETFYRAGAVKLFIRGMIANAINPKVILFFLAFLPQFVVADRGNAAGQMAVFGVIFTLQAALIFAGIAAAAGTLGEKLQKNPKVGCWLDRIAGMVFIALAIKLLI
ncbi:MAG: LysE family translocator [Burkholderiales bacterium]|jgi:threonine/homoserine/homoserine lactone efflux protein|nr:LysE family translocator [Burkholderiales bacterium]